MARSTQVVWIVLLLTLTICATHVSAAELVVTMTTANSPRDDVFMQLYVEECNRRVAGPGGAANVLPGLTSDGTGCQGAPTAMGPIRTFLTTHITTVQQVMQTLTDRLLKVEDDRLKRLRAEELTAMINALEPQERKAIRDQIETFMAD